MLLLFLLMLSLSGAEQETLCTSEACFTLHMDEVNFEKARSNCVNNGGYLVTIRDKKEENVLRLLLSQAHQHGRPLKIQIGLRLQRGTCVLPDTALRGFKWVSGDEDSQYSNWEKDPVYTCHERCVSVTYNQSVENHMKWADGGCKRKAFYICKFYFKGMCKALTLLGPGQINYTAPFSKEPRGYQLKVLPVGTYAEIFCSDNKSYYSVCSTKDGNTYSWTHSGPFCKTNRNCSTNNGGCDHVCQQNTDDVTCSCNDGYHLDEDGLSCRFKNLCDVDTCEYHCIMGKTGFTCRCPPGFELDSNQRTCLDIDECQSQVCGEHSCVNTKGSYFCNCSAGYEMVGGECRDVNECLTSRCEDTCLNSIGSFSCSCRKGFLLSEDGHSCKHSVTPSESPTVKETEENFTESVSNTVELQHESPHTNTPLQDFSVTNNNGQIDTAFATSLSKPSNHRVLICVLGSVIPLVLLVAITLGILIFRCSQVKKETKKNTTTDGYCWVSSGLDPRLEKLYESIPTDDL